MLTNLAIFNRMAKTVQSPRDRRLAYQRKTAILSRLIVVGADDIQELSLWNRLVLIGLPNGRRMHAPFRRLSTDAQAVVMSVVADRLTGKVTS